MGSDFNFAKLNAKSDTEATESGEELIREAIHEHGHGGYTGSFAECKGVAILPAPNYQVTDPEAYLEEICEKWGPMLIVKVGEKYFAGAVCSS